MEHLGMNSAGLVSYEVPGIEGYLSLSVKTSDGVFQIDIRKMPEPSCHALLPEDARAATREEAVHVMSRMVVACLAAAVQVPSEK